MALYLVGTPIGNLQDITIRALDTLRAASLIVAEDTRHTRKLLSHYDIHRPLLSYNEHSREGRVEEIMAAAQQGDVAVVADAGMPTVSDPGYELVTRAVELGIPVSVLPGPSAAISALAISGLPTDRFLFLGFLPRRARDRQEALEEVRRLPYTLIIYEAPHRLLDTLQAMLDVLGERRVSVVRELTKLHEEVLRTTIDEALHHWTQTEPRGEFTLVVEGFGGKADEAQVDPLGEVERLVGQGERPSAAIRQVAEVLGISRKHLYNQWVERGD